ncbi:MAG: SUMF1/EgtB/PvdO family nonheme iron enzyme [Myxococcales bacterium]|nr:SUMF1/EgtB/PvdO family nonheme iron enzyme [Myxococcales bacterium]
MTARPPAPPSASPATGEHVAALLSTGLDRYALRRLLGVGGMGEVYQGIHRTIEKEVAIKVLAYEHRQNPSLNERFLEEAKAASRIRHDHVVDITDFGHSPQGCAYFVMEYLEGEDLAHTLKREGALPWGRVQHFALQLLSALQAAHARGIVHRDIKPANCLRCTKHGDPDFIKVLDFGIARISGPDQPGERLTKAGTIMGTAEYMAPEQARGDEVDPRTDLYAVGVMLFEMVTGRLPFESRSSMEILAMHLYTPAPLASSVAPVPVAPEVDALIARALAKEPDERWASAEELAAAVAAIPAGPCAYPAAMPGMGGVTISNPAMTGPPPASSLPPTSAAPYSPSTPSWPGPITNPMAPHTGVSTGSFPPERGPGPGAKVLAVAAAVLGLGAVAGGVYWLTMRGDDSPPDASATAEPTTSPQAKPGPDAPEASPTPPAAAATCPEGMVRVEGGAFFMGTDKQDIAALATARPTHKVRLDAYCIDVDEVTVAKFHECSDRGECRRAFKDAWWPQGSSDEAEWTKSREILSTLCNERLEGHDQHPINCVTWAQARDYCEFRGQRLPTEAEWEYAARGSDGRVFPWGDAKPNHEHANLCNAECGAWRERNGLPPEGMLSSADDGWYGTAPVGSFPLGATQHGLRDVVGNVFEWTDSDFELYEGHPEGLEPREGKVIRGGAFNSAFAMFADPALRFPSDPEAHTHGIGFRCAATPEGS